MADEVLVNQLIEDDDGYVKEVDPNGVVVGWSKTIDNGDGIRASVFKGSTRKEVVNKMETSLREGTRRIIQQEKQIKLGSGDLVPDPEANIPQFKRRDLTADEQFAVAHGLTDRSRAPESIRTVIEAEFGAPIDTIRATLQKTTTMEYALLAKAAGDSFVSEHPEYVMCPENSKMMIAYLEKNKMAPTVKNMNIALDQLKEVLILRSAEELAKQETPVDSAKSSANQNTRTNERPRSASTALNDRDSSVSRVRVTPTLNGPSFEQLEAMSADQFESWQNNPANAAYYEKLIAARKSGR